MKKILLVTTVVLLAAGCNAATTNNGQHMMNGHMMNNSDMVNPHNSQNPIQSHRSYVLNLLSSTNAIKPNQAITITFNIKDDQGNILKDFEVEHTKLLHFIVVRNDLQYFQHLHPDFNQSTGEFLINLTFPADGPYKLFADYTPNGAQMGPMGMALGVVSSQDITVGDMAKYKAQPIVLDTQSTKTYNGYKVQFNFPNLTQANKPINFSLIISKNGKPVTDLEDYLGALAHSVIIGTDLSYQHIHAIVKNGSMASSQGSMQGMAMGNAMTGPDINFTTTFAQVGTYKIFTEFQEQGKVTTTDYAVEVK